MQTRGDESKATLRNGVERGQRENKNIAWRRGSTLLGITPGALNVSITVSITQGHIVARKQLELIADHVSHFAWCREACPYQLPLNTALCYTQPGTNRCSTLEGKCRCGWWRAHVDPIANQYVPNMQCLLWLVMKKQASWFIVMMPWEAEGGHKNIAAAQLSPGLVGN